MLIFPLRSWAVSIPPVWNVPAENYNFVGREEILCNIAELFKNAPLKTAVLSGPSGFGKSQIAKHYIYKSYPQYDIVWWFKGNQYLEPQFEEFALELGAFLGLELEGKIKAIDHGRLINIIKGAIRKKRLKCLLIFDDTETYHDIETYIPFSHEKNVHVLITTKNANFSEIILQIKPFKREESISYTHRFFPEEVREAKDKLASHMADYPAFIALAVEYIKNYPGMTIEDYIHKYNTETTLSPQILKEAAKKLGGPIDGYTTDMFRAIKLSLDELQRNSQEAFQLIGFLSLLSHTEINMSMIKQWLEIRHIDKDMLELMNPINRYSFVEVTTLKDKKKVYLSMHELIQKIIGTFIPLDEKRKLINEVTLILMGSFSNRSDQIVKMILKDTAPLMHAIKISEEADKINYHSTTLASLRVRILDILACDLRDSDKAKIIYGHLQRDSEQGIILPRKDQILYDITLFVFSATSFSDYQKAILHGNKASQLIQEEEEMHEEKMRLIANLIQYHSLIGDLDKCESLVKKGEKLLSLSQSIAYNSLFILATTMYLIDKAETQQAIDLITQNKYLFEEVSAYPIIRLFILNQLAEAYIKQGNIAASLEILKLSEKYGQDFYAHRKNVFFANLDVLKAACHSSNVQQFKNSEALLKQALSTYHELLGGEAKHKKQAFAHLILGKLYALNKHYEQAKEQYLYSEEIFEKLLQNKRIEDVSELYKSLVILGADMHDQVLAQKYLDKQLNIFGFDHPKTTEISLYFDEQKFVLPL